MDNFCGELSEVRSDERPQADAAAWTLEKFEDYLSTLSAEDRARLCADLARLRAERAHAEQERQTHFY